MENLGSLLQYFNDGVSDSAILFILVLIDTTLAVSYQIKQRQHLLSSTLLAGLLRNFVLCFMPFLVADIAKYHPRSDTLYQFVAAVLSLYIGYAIIQSILAYTDLWGVKYPDWLKKWLENEIEDKTKKSESDKDTDENVGSNSKKQLDDQSKEGKK